ncbi:hypothetical protein F5X71_34645 [Nocardia brasiliensis]|uniref:Uncharacterized protein n=1 Tax=Nocardia brasiliensis TaxID=37326 RepID=A0A6G9Y0W8_NOCBR|nr:hypothetical protein [Nocardia brasiliensis]QIS06766.1 hypothetical protein F5X71_34645 [Nocardia brasiliensis]
MFSRKKGLDAYVGAVLYRFVVTCKDGTVISGVLTAVSARTLVFDDIQAYQDGGGFVPAPGRLYIDRAEVRYSQLVESGGR